MIKADSKYNGVVTTGSHLYESQQGNLGYQVMLECQEGATSFTIWLTDKNRDNAKRYFQILGVDESMLRDPGDIEYQLGLDIEGREVSFGTRDKEYNGRHSVDVVWIGKKSDPSLPRSAARYFCGDVEQPSRSGDIPF